MGKKCFEITSACFKDFIRYPDFVVQSGSTIFIEGASGTGKSSLLKILNGVNNLSDGQINFFGQDIDDIDTIELRRRVTLVGQSVFLFDMSIRENFREFYRYRGLDLISDGEIREYLDICLVDFDIDADCSQMSGGEKHRVYIAIFLSLSGEVILLDEPTAALDENNSINLIGNIKSFAVEKGKTLIIVSHNTVLAEKFADSVISITKEASYE
ncbi:MAG: ATP-binding cassette domain-containing protein [Anaerovoracaceae bacterium]